VYQYGSKSTSKEHSAFKTHIHVLRAVASKTIWPGGYIELEVPLEDSWLAIESHSSSAKQTCTSFPNPAIVHTVGHKIRTPNLTSEPINVKRNDQFCQMRSVEVPKDRISDLDPVVSKPAQNPSVPCSSSVSVDPDGVLTEEARNMIHKALIEHYEVFGTSLDGYNDKAGPFQAHVNMGPVQPPQRKGRVPQYSRNQLEELQCQFDELERLGVFKRPEEIGIQVEYLNPSFLVKKDSGGFRLVTAFSEVARYSKTQPSLMPDVDSIL
jgi:hypothetical protein